MRVKRPQHFNCTLPPPPFFFVLCRGVHYYYTYSFSNGQCVSQTVSCTSCATWNAWTNTSSAQCGSVRQRRTCRTKAPAGCTGAVAAQTRTITLSCPRSNELCYQSSCVRRCVGGQITCVNGTVTRAWGWKSFYNGSSCGGCGKQGDAC